MLLLVVGLVLASEPCRPFEAAIGRLEPAGAPLAAGRLADGTILVAYENRRGQERLFELDLLGREARALAFGRSTGAGAVFSLATGRTITRVHAELFERGVVSQAIDPELRKSLAWWPRVDRLVLTAWAVLSSPRLGTFVIANEAETYLGAERVFSGRGHVLEERRVLRVGAGLAGEYSIMFDLDGRWVTLHVPPPIYPSLRPGLWLGNQQLGELERKRSPPIGADYRCTDPLPARAVPWWPGS